MKALARTRRGIWLFRHQPLAIRLLAGSAGLLTAAAAFAAPAEANPVDDNFLGALTNAGINFGHPGGALTLGQSICPMLAKPGGSFVSAVERVKGNGMSPDMAGMFATIAIQAYCPSMIGNIASGNFSGLPQIPGLPGV